MDENFIIATDEYGMLICIISYIKTFDNWV